jgi:hypothetical protein
VRAAPRVPLPERGWEQLPAGHPEGRRYRLVPDETTRLLDEFEAALEAGDDGPALAALERLAKHVGMEPPR